MTLKRLTPVVSERDLGSVQLWRDELAEIVRLMWQIDGTSISIEADDYTVTDVSADLPQIGPKLRHFKATAARDFQQGDRLQMIDVLEVSFSRKKSYIKAEDPNLQTIGAMEAICSLAGQCRRLPHWLDKAIHAANGAWNSIFFFGIAAPLVLGSVLLLIVAKLYNNYVPFFVFYGIVAATIVASLFMITIISRASTILRTGTHAEAPTWWQEHRSDLGINAAFSVVFLILGAVVGHYWH